jgi:hypothetical protein
MKANLIKYFTIALVFSFYYNSFSQSEDRGNYDYDQEIVLGVNKNTVGGLIGAISIKKGSRIDDDNFRFFGIDFANIKNPKEVRYPSVLGNTFIFGKSNYLYSIRPYVGRERIIYKKATNQGVQISLLAAVGPSIGVIAPYIIEYSVSRVQTVREQYNPIDHPSRFNILGTGKLFEGIGDSDFTFGGNAKAGINFEFGTFKSNVTSLELGYQLEGFTKKVQLMPTTVNQQIFSSLYFTLYFGLRK